MLILRILLIKKKIIIKINDFYKMIDFLNLDSKDVFNYEIESVKKKTRKK